MESVYFVARFSANWVQWYLPRWGQILLVELFLENLISILLAYLNTIILSIIYRNNCSGVARVFLEGQNEEENR